MKTLLYVKYARLEIDLMVHRGQPLEKIDALLSRALAEMAGYAQLMQKRGTWRQHEMAWPPLTRIAELLVPHPEKRREALAELDQLRGYGEFTEIDKQLGFLRSYVATAIQVKLIRSDMEFCEFFIEAVENSRRDGTGKRLNHEEYVLGWIKWFTDNIDSRNLISKDAAYGGDMALVGGLRASWDLVARCANGDSPAFPLLLVHAAEHEIRLDPDIIRQLSRIGSDSDIIGEVEYEDQAMFETALRHFTQLTATEITTDEQEAFLHFGLEFLDRILAAKGDFTNDALDIEQKWQEIMGRQGPDLLSICELSTRFEHFQEFLSARNIRNQFMARSYDIARAAMKRVGGYYDDLASQQYDFTFFEGDDANNLERLMKLAIKFRDDSQLKTEIGAAMSIRDMTERDLALVALPLKGTAREDLLKVSTYESLVGVFHESGGLDARRDNQAMLKFSSTVRDRLASYIVDEADTARANMDLEALQTLKTRLLAMKGNSFAGRTEEWPFFDEYQMYFRFFAAVPCTLEPDFVAEGFTGMLLGVVQFEIDTITVMAPIFPMLADAVDRTIALGDAADVASHLKGMDDIRRLLGQQDDAYLGLMADLWPDTAALVPENFHPGQPFRELFERELTYIRERLVAANAFTGRLAKLEARIAGAIADEDGFLEEQMGGLEKQDENFQSWIWGHEAYGRMIAWLGTMARQDLTRHVGFVDLTKNAFGQDTGNGSALAKYFADEWAPGLAVVNAHQRNQSQLDAAGYRKRMRYLCADAVRKWKHRSIDLFDERFDTAALIAMIGLLVDEIHDDIAPAAFSTEWRSANIHRWAQQYPASALQHTRADVRKNLIELRDSWLPESPETFRQTLGKAAAPRSTETLPICLAYLSQAPEYIQYYFVEQIDPLLDLLDVDTGKSKESNEFLDAYQIDFHLRNEFGHDMLSSLTRQDMELDLVNRTADTLTLGDPQLPPGVADPAMACHFVLRFKTGVLTDTLDNIRLLGPSEHWELVGRVHRPATMPLYDELYIRGPQGETIPPGHARYLTLQEMRAQDHGDRTTQMLLLFQGLSHEGGPALRGHREKRLSIANALPSDRQNTANLPIVTQFVGPNTILNDGISPSQLTIGITSIAPPDRRGQVGFRSFSHRAATPKTPARTVWSRSKIVMWIDTKDVQAGEQKDWALCTKSQAAGITATLANDSAGNSWDVAFMGQGIRAEWVFTPPRDAAAEDQVLRRGKSLTLTLANVRSSLHAGPAQINFRFEDFPGYPDRDYVLQVFKSRLQEREGADKKGGLFDTPRDVSFQMAGELEVTGSATVDGVTHATVPAGTIIVWAGSEADKPEGWMICDGREVPDERKYHKLRRVLAGSDDIPRVVNTPDLAGRTVIGAMNPTAFSRVVREDAANLGTESYVGWPEYVIANQGRRGGEWSHQLTYLEMPSHTHGLNGGDFGSSYKYDLQLNDDGKDVVDLFHRAMMDQDAAHRNYLPATDYYGGNQRHMNVQPYLALFHLIKY